MIARNKTKSTFKCNWEISECVMVPHLILGLGARPLAMILHSCDIAHFFFKNILVKVLLQIRHYTKYSDYMLIQTSLRDRILKI